MQIVAWLWWPKEPKMQLKFDFKQLKVGDLVMQNAKEADIAKKWGVVLELSNGKYLDAVRVHWMNYGTFWTVSDKLIKVNKDEQG